MIKRFCDQCGAQMDKSNSPLSGLNSNRLEASIGHLMVQVITSQNGAANAGDYCVHCILDALYKLDDRPKGAACILDQWQERK